MPTVVQYHESIQYTGSNGSYICGTWADLDLVSDNGTTLTFSDGSAEQSSVTSGGWLIKSQPFPEFVDVKTNTAYLDGWRNLPPVVSLTLASGYALTPTIGASASANVSVDLDTAFPDTSYSAHAVLAGSSTLLADLSITAVSITDTNTVTVTVHNSGALSLAGATVIVSAGDLVT